MSESNFLAASASMTAASASDLRATILRAAWLAILLGLAMEGIEILLAANLGRMPASKSLAAGLVQKVSWSTLVCTGLAFGVAASEGRSWSRAGLTGLLAAPTAFIIARSLQKAIISTLGSAGPPVLLLMAIKGVEYGCLGTVVVWLAGRAWGGAVAHAGAGLLTGTLFGSAVLALSIHAATKPLAPAALISQVANEWLFPVGCALTLFAAQSLGKRLQT